MTDTRAPQFQGVLIAFLGICTISVAARCYTRLRLVRIFAVEDYLAVAAYVSKFLSQILNLDMVSETLTSKCLLQILYAAYTICALISIKYGLCSHVSDVPLEERPKAIMWRWIAITLYILVSGLTKLIVGIFLTRVCTRQRWHNIVNSTTFHILSSANWSRHCG